MELRPDGLSTKCRARVGGPHALHYGVAMGTFTDSQELLALLDWYRAMGVDTAVGEDKIDWLEHGAAPPGKTFVWPARHDTENSANPALELNAEPASFQKPQPAARSVARPAATPAPTTNTPYSAPSPVSTKIEAGSRAQTPLAASAAELDSRRIANAASTLDALEAALRAFSGCALKSTAKNLCFYRGAPAARLMVIGEAPGREEDLEGKPFVGRDGQLLDKMLSAIGMSEADVHITNLVYWRPPGNRTPTPQEALACRPFLDRQIELVGPDIILLLGGMAAKEILGATESIMRLRGRWREISSADKKVAALATLHPAYLLRTPAAKQLAWSDLLALKLKLAATASS